MTQSLAVLSSPHLLYDANWLNKKYDQNKKTSQTSGQMGPNKIRSNGTQQKWQPKTCEHVGGQGGEARPKSPLQAGTCGVRHDLQRVGGALRPPPPPQPPPENLEGAKSPQTPLLAHTPRGGRRRRRKSFPSASKSHVPRIQGYHIP